VRWEPSRRLVAFHAQEACIGAEKSLRRKCSTDEPQAELGTTSGMQTEAGWALQGVDFHSLEERGRRWLMAPGVSG
jgi:hypothetical protein